MYRRTRPDRSPTPLKSQALYFVSSPCAPTNHHRPPLLQRSRTTGHRRSPRARAHVSSSADHRELHRRRPKTLALTTPPPAKKTSAMPPSTAAPPRRRARQHHPTSGSGAGSVGSASADETVRPGTVVLARTRTATLRTGQVLVLWLKAVVVYATDGGYEIVYDGGWPRDDPHATVRVARDHVRLPNKSSPSPSPSTTTTTSPPSLPTSTAASSRASTVAAVANAPKKEMRPAPRPTTAGKFRPRRPEDVPGGIRWL
ncbi:hypothetical protein ACP4OV_007312 [Aristida adscensionis]